MRSLRASDSSTMVRAAMALLATFFDRLGRFGVSALVRAANPEASTAIAHLGDVLGDQAYESLARKGETMTTAATAYAYDQIDQARAELNAVSK